MTILFYGDPCNNDCCYKFKLNHPNVKNVIKINSLPFSGNIRVSRANGLWYITWGQRRKHVKKWERPGHQNILTSFFLPFNVPLNQDRSGIWLTWLRFRLGVNIPVCKYWCDIIPLLFRCYWLVLTAWWSVLSLRVWNNWRCLLPFLCGPDSWILIVQAWLPTLHWMMLSLPILFSPRCCREWKAWGPYLQSA